MAQIITNDSAFPATKIDLDGNLVTITMGNSISVSMGMSNAAYFGAKTQLVAGVTTNITVGQTSTCTFGSILGSTYGNCWAWTAANNTTFDVATRWGATQNVFAGGISNASYTSRDAEEAQGRSITLIVLGSYIVTMGLTLYGMQYPPFKMVDEDNDGYASGVTTNGSAAWTAFATDCLLVLALGLAMKQEADLFSGRNKIFDPVSFMEYTAAGVNYEVYQFPDNFASPAVIDKVWKPANTATQNAKAGFYMRPYRGTEMPAIPPLNRAPIAYQRTGALAPDIELLTTRLLPVPGFSQIFMTPTGMGIGVGAGNISDTNIAGVKTSLAEARIMATTPNIILDAMESSVTISLDLIKANSISMGTVTTEIKRPIGTVSIKTGTIGPSQFTLSNTSAELATAAGSVAISAVTGDTTITAAGVIAGSFSPTATGVCLRAGPSMMQISAGTVRYTGVAIELG